MHIYKGMIMDTFFKFGERGTSVGQEVRAGFTTFLAMAYIIAVNPLMLAAAGVPTGPAITSTCIGAGIMTIAMGLFSNRPLACASGMGINAVVGYTLTEVAGGDWHAAMAVVFLEGVVILALVLCGLREAVMDAIPASLRHAIAVGLGLFIAFIGLKDGGIVVSNESTFITMGSVTSPTFIVAIVSIVVTIILHARHVKGDVLIGILAGIATSYVVGIGTAPTGVVSALDFSSFGAPFQTDAQGVSGLMKVFGNPTLLVFVFSLMMSDFFDTMGTAVAVAKQGDFLTEDGKVENINEILVVDSCAAAMGGLLGASSLTTFVESASGAADGGRTGLASIVTGFLFILAASFAPLIAVVNSAATCGALVLVGYLMMTDVVEIDWSDPMQGFPAFCTIAGIPLTYSISTGIGLGFIIYVVLAVARGRAKQVNPLMWVAAIAFLLAFNFA